MPKKPFIFNDESIKNSYGFIIPTAGISLKRFKKNPIMLDSHYNSTQSVLGKWKDIVKENGLLTGLPEFDSEDETVTRIEGKVNRGFITSCSMGITFHRDDLKIIAGQLVLTKCELYEVSIVAVPSNANSVRLYSAENGELLNDDEVQQLCLNVIDVKDIIDLSLENKNKNRNMKVKLTPAVALILGLTADSEIEVAALEAKIVSLDSEKKAAELKLSERKTADEQAKLQVVTNQVETALTTGQITADNKDEFIQLGIANPTLLTSTLAAIPVKKEFKALITGGESVAIKTAEDFQKLTLEAQLEFKKTQPAEYQKLFTIKQ